MKAAKYVFRNQVPELQALQSRHPNLASLRDGFDQATLLHVAAQYPGTNDAIKFLLREHADPNAQDVAGDTPMHRHKRTNLLDKEVIQILLNAGADPYLPNRSGKTFAGSLQQTDPEEAEILDMCRQVKQPTAR